MADNKTGIVPPQNIEAEASLIDSILMDGEAIGQIADTVKAGDFYEERHRIIFEAIVSLYDSHRPIDLLTLSDALKKSKQLDKVGGSSYLAELTNQVPTASNVEYYAEIVAEK